MPFCLCIEAAFIIRVVPQAGKVKRILSSDWLPERARYTYLARSGLPPLNCPTRKDSVVAT